MAKGKSRAARSRSRRSRSRRSHTAQVTRWWLRPRTLGLLTWVGVIGTCGPQIVSSARWLGEQGQNYADNRVLDRIMIDADRRIEQWAHFDANIAAILAEGDAWRAAHPRPKQ